MLCRWDTAINDLNLALQEVKRLTQKLIRKKEETRGRGESLFGSLTNEFGDRLHARSEQALQSRVLGRIISYQIKLLIRCNGKIISLELIIRHAL